MNDDEAIEETLKIVIEYLGSNIENFDDVINLITKYSIEKSISHHRLIKLSYLYAARESYVLAYIFAKTSVNLSVKNKEKETAYFIAGSTSYMIGRPEEAEEHYKLALQFALQADPKNASIHLSYGMLLFEIGRHEEAKEQYRLALQADSKNINTHLNYGEFLFKKGYHEEAEEQYRLALQVDPKHVTTHVNYGKLLALTARHEEAEEHYKLALQADPKNASIHLSYGVLLSEIGRHEEAEEHYKLALQADPKNVFIHLIYGTALSKIGLHEKAEEQYRLALQVDPKHVTTHVNYGILLSEMGRHEEAEEQYRLALQADSKNAFSHSEYGVFLFKMGHPEEAEEHYKLALQANSKDINTHLNYGEFLFKTGRREETEEHYKLALQVDPKNVITHVNYGILLSKMGRHEEAEEHYKLALQVDPKNVITHVNYGKLLALTARHEEAEEQYRLALQVDPKNATIHSYYGTLLSEIGRPEEAEGHHKLAIELDPKSPNIHLAYSSLLASMGLENEKNAIEEMETASRLFGEKGDKIRGHFALALLYEELANKHYDLKSYLRSGEYCENSGNEYIKAGKHAGENFETDSPFLARGYIFKGRAKIRNLDFINFQTLSTIELFRKIMNDVYAASKCYKKAAEASPIDNLVYNACSTSMRCLSEILDCMLAVTKQEEVQELKDEIKKWEEDLAICQGIYKGSKKGEAFIQSLHKLIICVEKLEQYKLSGRWKAEVAFEECYFELKTTASTIESPLQNIIERSAEQMDLYKHEIMPYKGIKTKLLKSTVDSLESMDREPAGIQELDYVLTEQPWYCIPFPETIEYDVQKLLKLAEGIDVMLLTATDVEKEAVMKLLKPLPKKNKILMGHIGAETYYIGMFGKFKAVVTKCETGSLGSGSTILATYDGYKLWSPRAIIMIGIAFGKDSSKQKIGDVLVSSQIISYEPARIGENNIQFRGPNTPSDPTLRNRFNNVDTWKFLLPDGTPARREIGPILSGEKLIDEPEFKAFLFNQYPQAIGGEMEGAGLTAASIRVGLPWILVKSICDWGENKHGKHQQLAAAAAASLVHHVLSHKGAFDGFRVYPKSGYLL